MSATCSPTPSTPGTWCGTAGHARATARTASNPVSEWVWSPEPVHEALVDLETFVEAQQVASRRERSRTSAGLNPDPRARRVYPLRSYLFCAACGRRIFGNTRREVASYACAPKKAWLPDGHPAIFRVREDHLLDGLTAFLADQVFGAYRHSLLAATSGDAARQERSSQVTAVRRAITETETKSKRLIRNLELADDIDQDFIRDINERRAELRARGDDLRRQLAGLQDHVHRAPNPALLEQLPVTQVDLAGMPDAISRRLFEALRLEIRYDHNTHGATCQITLTGETIGTVARASQEATASASPPRPRGAAQDGTGGAEAEPEPPAGMACVAGQRQNPADQRLRDVRRGLVPA